MSKKWLLQRLNVMLMISTNVHIENVSAKNLWGSYFYPKMFVLREDQ